MNTWSIGGALLDKLKFPRVNGPNEDLKNLSQVPKSPWKESSPVIYIYICVLVVFVRKVEMPCNYRSEFPGSRLSIEDSCESRTCSSSSSWTSQK